MSLFWVLRAEKLRSNSNLFLRFEKHILGGDAVFMKKIFKAIGQLGSKADAAVLASRFDVSAEARPDVAEAYEATMKKLGKKKR